MQVYLILFDVTTVIVLEYHELLYEIANLIDKYSVYSEHLLCVVHCATF